MPFLKNISISEFTRLAIISDEKTFLKLKAKENYDFIYETLISLVNNFYVKKVFLSEKKTKI